MRLFLAFFLFVSVFALPVWITVPFISYHLIRYEDPFELIFLGLMIDLVHGTPTSTFLSTRFFATIVATGALVAVSLIKTYLRVHEYLPSKQKGW